MLHVIPYFAPAFRYGGPPRSVLGLCRGLRRAGVEVQVFTTTANGAADLPTSFSGVESFDDIPVHYFPLTFPRRLFGARGMNGALSAGLGAYDVLHIHGLWNMPAWTAARRARQAGVPYVVSPRGMLEPGSLAHHAGRKRLAYRMVERANLSGAALLHATSTAEARTLKDHGLNVPVVMLPNGVDVGSGGLTPRGTFRLRLGVPGDQPLIVFLGRIHPTKRLDLLADAFERVRAVRSDVHLVIAGPDDGGYRQRVEPCFARSAEGVRWTGELDEPAKWSLLADADALVLCSDSESFGMSVVEALSAGVPVVVTRTCPWEEVEIARCGFWVSQDAEAIARAVLGLLGDRERARAMGERGRALARARYSWDSIARSMADHYRAVAATARPVVSR